MKITIKYLCIAFLTFTTLLSCKPSSGETKSFQEQANLPAKLETVSLHIEGMTCEIGCAKTIESKISKLDGVSVSKVNFEEKKGTFTYDANKTSEATITTTINGLLDGKTYTATLSETCCTAKENSACTEACAKKCGHQVGETCDKCTKDNSESCCVLDKKDTCDKVCAEKCGHKEGESCAHCETKKKDCKPNCEKPCCSTEKK